MLWSVQCFAALSFLQCPFLKSFLMHRISLSNCISSAPSLIFSVIVLHSKRFLHLYLPTLVHVWRNDVLLVALLRRHWRLPWLTNLPMSVNCDPAPAGQQVSLNTSSVWQDLEIWILPKSGSAIAQGLTVPCIQPEEGNEESNLIRNVLDMPTVTYDSCSHSIDENSHLVPHLDARGREQAALLRHGSWLKLHNTIPDFLQGRYYYFLVITIHFRSRNTDFCTQLMTTGRFILFLLFLSQSYFFISKSSVMCPNCSLSRLYFYLLFMTTLSFVFPCS